MGEDFGTWIPQPHLGWQPPDPNAIGAPQGLGQQNFITAYGKPGSNMLLTNGTMPPYASSEFPQPQVGRPNEPKGWFYCLPRSRQAFMPATDSGLKEKVSSACHESPGGTFIPYADSAFEQKRLLVNNPSGYRTTLVLSSEIVNPLQCRTSWNPYQQQGAYYLDGDDPRNERDFKNLSGAVLTDEFKGNDECGAESEMHEDTEELNALLYSDGDSDYTEDDEVTSTGHSPSTMTVHDKQNWFEEVASSDGMNKKRKLFDGGNDGMPSVMDTASPMKHNRSLELEDDAESSCACNRSSGLREVDSWSSNKKMRKEKIRETINILQNIIPDGKGKDAIVVLDEAIHYLKSLKLKAKAFGLDSL